MNKEEGQEYRFTLKLKNSSSCTLPLLSLKICSEIQLYSYFMHNLNIQYTLEYDK